MSDLDHLMGYIDLWRRKHLPDVTVEDCAYNVIKQANQLADDPANTERYADVIIGVLGMYTRMDGIPDGLRQRIKYKLRSLSK